MATGSLGPDALAQAGETPESCVPNISWAERRKRLAGGALGLVVGCAAFAALVSLGLPREWRLALLPMFWGAAVGFFQWRDKT